MKPSLQVDLKLQARVLSVSVVLLGLSVWLGWVFGLEILKSLLPGLPSMKPNTAISLTLCGGSLGLACNKSSNLSIRLASFVLTGIAMLMAAATLAEYVLNWNFALNSLFIKSLPNAGIDTHLNRTSITSAVMFLLIGAALYLMTAGRHYALIQALALTTGILAILAFGGYLFGHFDFPFLMASSGMAAHTAFGFFGLAAGILLATAQNGWLPKLLPHIRTISITVSVCILFISIVAMMHSTNQNRKTVDAVVQKYSLLSLIKDITSEALEYQSIHRSYLLTGNSSLLPRGGEVADTIFANLDALKHFTVGNPGQRVNLSQLTGQFESLFTLTGKLILLRQNQGTQTAAEILDNSEIERLYQNIIGTLTGIEVPEHNLLQEQLKSAELKDSISKIVMSTVLALSSGVLLLTFNILNNEIKQRKQSERLEKSRSKVLELLACGAAFPSVLEAIVLGVEDENPEMHCSILLLDETGKRLLHGAAPSLPAFYIQAIDGVEIGYGVGSCGTAASTGQRVVVSDIQSHPFWTNFKDLAQQADLASCWSEPIFSSQGQVLGTFAIYHPDIHYPSQAHLALIEQTAKLASIAIEKHHIDLALKASETRYRNLFEANPLPMWVFDVETLNFLAVDDAAIEHYGYSREEFLSMKITDIRPTADRERLQQIIRTVGTHAQKVGSWTHLTKDGREIKMEITAQRLLFEGRQAVITLANDVTERLQIEQQLRKLSMAVEQSPESIVITDLEATIEYVNDAFTRISGYSRQESIGKNIGLIQSGLTSPDIYEQLWTTLREGRIWQGEFINKHKDGTLYNEYSIIVPIKDKQGMISHYVAIQEDVTEKMKINAELAQHRHHLEGLVLQRTSELQEAKAAAEAANIAKSVFLSNMSHEIRSPMNAVLGFCYLLEHQSLPEESLDLVHKIHSSGKTLLAIINDILDFSKIEAGRLDIENQPFQLNDILENLANLMSANAGSKNLELAIIPPLGVNYLIGDELRLQQILVNLLINAIKFTEAGEVELNINIETENENRIDLRFSVKDTGIGISQEQQQSIFDAFSQADSSISRRFGGTGLGLAICQQLVSLMGGRLNITSKLGAGSEFWFTLPLQRYTQALEKPVELHHLEVLVVDDCETVRNALQRLVTSFGWKADMVNSGENAVLQALAKRPEPYDVILLDWKMPGLDGIATAQALKQALAEQSPPAKKLPIILMVTAFSQDELKTQPGIEYIDGMVNKPVTPSSLLDALHRALQRDKTELAAQPAEANKQPHCRLTDVRILVVDDSEMNREVARRILAREGAVISEARDGQEALDWLLEHNGMVDVVLMDVQMPRLDGYAATRMIRQQQNFSSLPVLALTAGAFKNLQDAALDAGMDDFISKPFNADLLIQKIQYWSHQQDKFNATQSRIKKQSIIAITDMPELTGINLTRGLELWGELDDYRHYLARFVSQYRHAGAEIIQSANAGDTDAVAALAHKLQGSAASLALDKIYLNSQHVEKALANPTLLVGAAEALQQAIDEVAGSVSDWLAITAESSEIAPDHRSNQNNKNVVKALLENLLKVLDEDTPANAKPLISKLETLLDTQVLEEIKASILNFDFRKAEDLTRKLIDSLL